MLELDERCKRFGIDFSIGGGNALGAVRHGGFLPWDDDVDIYITRDNYQKILAVRDEFFTDDFILVDYKGYPGYANPLPRIVSTDDTVLSRSRMADGTPKGTFLELFILDPMPRDSAAQDAWLKKHWLYTELVTRSFRIANPSVSGHFDLALYEEWLGRCEREERFEVLGQLEDELFCVREEDAVEFCARWGTHDCIYPVAAFASYTRIKFGEVDLPVAVGVIDNLYADYGEDWMYIPKAGTEHTHNIIENMHVPYEHFMADCEAFIDAEQLQRDLCEHKELLVRAFDVERKTHLARLDLKAAAVRAQLGLSPLDEKAADSALVSGEFSYLEERYGYWRSMQLSKSFWKWNVAIELEDSELFFALAWLFAQGDYAAAIKIAGLADKQDGLGERTRGLLAAMEGVRGVYRALGHRELAAAQAAYAELARGGYPYWDMQFDYRYLGVYLATRGDACDASKLAGFEEDVAKLLAENPDNGVVASLAADVALLGGKKPEAAALYKQALETTRNEFTQRHARRRMSQIEGGQR